MENYNQPAFPPQVAQDNLGRIIAPIPGMTKLEYAAIQLLPFFLEIRRKSDGLTKDGKNITTFQAAAYAAKELFETINKINNEKDTLQIIE